MQQRYQQRNQFRNNPNHLPRRAIIHAADNNLFRIRRLCESGLSLRRRRRERQAEGSVHLKDDFTTLRGRSWTPCGLPELIYELGRCVRVLAACLVQFEENSWRKNGLVPPRILAGNLRVIRDVPRILLCSLRISCVFVF